MFVEIAGTVGQSRGILSPLVFGCLFVTVPTLAQPMLYDAAFEGGQCGEAKRSPK